MQSRFDGECNPPLLHQLAPQRLAEGFAGLNPTARQVPARDIAVLDQEHAIVPVQHHGADAERHATGEPPVQVENPPQPRLKSGSQLLQLHRHRSPEVPDIAFDPCLAAAGLPIHGGILEGNT